MQQLIQLLPDVIANQIAAGEVVQRPASVLKELLENAIDAGATRIDVQLKNAGKTLIRVADNGSGMSVQDARMCFERHATSKIKSQKDLFSIRTLGFRGEALASIAAVAQVRLRTRLEKEELGTEVEIEGGKFIHQQAVAAPPGSVFDVKNLFFNVPARRNFLRSNPVETRHIMNEFIRVALPNPKVHLTFTHNDTEVYHLVPGTTEERLIGLFGSDLQGKLRLIDEATGYARIWGFIASPEIYRKNRSEQFFFVNGRYIRSNYLNHAIFSAFQDFIPKEHYPFYCINLELDPVHVDINIHPTKTEVKFDDEQTLYALLQSMIKRALGEFDNAPEFDFSDSEIQQAIYQSRPQSGGQNAQRSPSDIPKRQQIKPADWEPLYKPTQAPESIVPQTSLTKPLGQTSLFGSVSAGGAKPGEEDAFLLQFQNRYILTQQGENLLIIDQNLAHQRILFERFLSAWEGEQLACQQLLFPQTLNWSASDYQALKEASDILLKMGFEVKDFGENSVIVYGTPAGIGTARIKSIFEQVLSDIQALGHTDRHQQLFEQIARTVAAKSAVTSPQKMSILEMKNVVEGLFRCAVPGFAPNGKPTFRSLTLNELERFFAR